MTLSPEQLHIIQHSLGCDNHGRTDYRGGCSDDHFGRFYRNRYFTDLNTPCGQQCAALVAAGLMQDHGPQKLAGDMHLFTVTRVGMDAMRMQSPKPPVLTAAQKRYREWLDADCGLSFGEWLKARKAYESDWARAQGGRETAYV